MSTALAAASASGYEGPPELTLTRALTEWTLDPWMLALILLLGGAYLAGVRHVRRSAKPPGRDTWPGRTPRAWPPSPRPCRLRATRSTGIT